MPENQWEDDDDDLFGEEETTDMGDGSPPPFTKTPDPTVGVAGRTGLEGRRPHDVYPSSLGQTPSNRGNGKGKRTVRVRPMPAGMIAKWPDVVSCLITTGAGKQVMFVKGG